MNAMIRYANWIGWRTVFLVSRQSSVPSSSSTAAIGLNPSVPESLDKTLEDSTSTPPFPQMINEHKLETGIKSKKLVSNVKENKRSIVAAAFANLKSGDVIDSRGKRPFSLDEYITTADSMESLLSIADLVNISRRHALRVVSTLADWTAENRIKLSDFEADPRFVKLCRLLARGLPQNNQDPNQDITGFGDLAMVLGVTGDDEAAKLVAGISLDQMIRVMSTLALKRRRSTPLLRSLAFNIGRSNEILDVKQGADVLYAMAVLNFPDESLLDRTCSNLCESISLNRKSAVTGSILTSVGRLRFKHTELLDGLSEWFLNNMEICRSQDVVALLLTLATVGYTPSNADQLFDSTVLQISLKDVATPLAWLDIVWSLVILGRASNDHVASVLSTKFQEKIAITMPDLHSLNVATKLKLLNINAAAEFLMPSYKGPYLEKKSDIYRIPLKRSKEKQILVSSMIDSLSNLLPSAIYLKTDVDTGMGFLLDGECVIDDKCNPLPVSDTIVDRKATRVSIIAWDYADMCRGTRMQPCGVADLAVQLLEAKGFQVLTVPHTEFNPRDKLVVRVQYLEQQLKSLVKNR